jgi:type IV pilus assembly protein PilC
MPIYKYEALNINGKVVRGSLTAANEIDLESRLHGIGLDLLEAAESKTSSFSFVGSKISTKDLILICIQLEQLERAGVPILEALNDMRDTSDTPAVKTLMTEVAESVKGGKMLSAALAEHPATFDEVFVGLIAAGEKTGKLYEVFAHLAEHLKWGSEIRSKIKKATTYPLFLLALMFGIVALMMLFVIPKLSSFLLAQNFELPVYTRALIATSNFFKNFWYLLILIPITTYFSVSIIARVNEPFAYFIDSMKLNIPILGKTVRKIELARFCRFFSITYKSGIGILDCLEIASNVVKNKVLKESILLTKKSVSDGNSLTASMRSANQFPNLVLRMIKVGEDSGNLDKTLENVNFFYDREVNDSVNAMLGTIQPALTIILGGIMLWVSIAVFGPLYSSFSKMNF